jgi:hypothetical protein
MAILLRHGEYEALDDDYASRFFSIAKSGALHNAQQSSRQLVVNS